MQTAPSPCDDAAIPLADDNKTAQPAWPITEICRENPVASGCRFSTYRADRVSMTSSLWSGGDWHWCLTGPAGDVLADCGGFRNESECLTVIELLRANAGSARSPRHH